ncbi:hypothetical protein AB0L53_58335 [Nonomuraea sp. NPDC052129]|uniref:hypothetical protein n=1 Tax=Nonomuraea sp. NPDC052129 TaxID=3154651 RepID=UPI00344473B6
MDDQVGRERSGVVGTARVRGRPLPARPAVEAGDEAPAARDPDLLRGGHRNPVERHRQEAIAGLARRRVRRIAPHVIRVLENGAVSGRMLAAIACLGDHPHLLPYVELYADDDGDEELVEAMRQHDSQTRASFTPNPCELAEALRECDPEARAARDAFASDLTEVLHVRLPELDFGVYGEICEPGLTLVARGQTLCWPVESLYEKAGGDPGRAAEMVATDLS